MVDRETADEIEAAAARWVWRLDRQSCNPALEAELRHWLAGDTRRCGAFLHANAVWSIFDGLPTVAEDGPAYTHLSLEQPFDAPRRRFLMTAGIAVAAVAGGLSFILLPERYRTATGEIRHLSLADGSSVALNTDASLAVSLERKVRRIGLDRGEAWFQVTKNPVRPFLVESGQARVQAIGTAFSVRRSAVASEILVTEGIVEIWRAGAERRRVRMVAGDRALISTASDAIEKSHDPSAIDRALAWRFGELQFAGETLLDAAEQFNRYNTRKIVVVGTGLANERIYGVFRLDEPESFANAAVVSLDAVVMAATADKILISKRI